MNFIGISVLFVILACQTFQSEGAKKSYEGYSVYWIVPNDTAQVDYLTTLMKQNRKNGMKLDFWDPPQVVGKKIEVLVSPNDTSNFLGYLAAGGIAYQVTVENLEKLIQAERKPAANLGQFELKDSVGTVMRDSPLGSPDLSSTTFFDFSDYYRFNDILDYLKSLQSQYPNRLSLSNIGHTIEGRPLVVAKVTNGDNVQKPAIYMDGGIHAREWIAPLVPLYILQKLLTDYDTNSTIRAFVDNMDWYFFPVVNPDGYEYTQTEDRMWRKNRSPQSCNGGMCCAGVDLNRNFDWFHCGSGASTDACDEIYCGSVPFSELETQAIRDFILSKKNQIKAFLTFHSYAQIWMYPYGYRKNTYPPDRDQLMSVANKAANALQSLYGTKYVVGTAADTLYEASGGSDDWAKGKAGIPFVYLLELRPCDDCSAGFILPAHQIIPTIQETWAGVAVVAQEMMKRYATAPVPVPAPATVQMQVPSTTASSNCVDMSERCPWWKIFGRCRYPQIKNRCGKSCGDC